MATPHVSGLAAMLMQQVTNQPLSKRARAICHRLGGAALDIRLRSDRRAGRCADGLAVRFQITALLCIPPSPRPRPRSGGRRPGCQPRRRIIAPVVVLSGEAAARQTFDAAFGKSPSRCGVADSTSPSRTTRIGITASQFKTGERVLFEGQRFGPAYL